MTTKTNKAPKHLKAATRLWFENVVNEYELESHHLRLLILACEAWDRCEEARKAVGEHGLTFSNRHGEIKLRPEVTVERENRTAFARLLRELNLDSDSGPANSRPPALKY
jgi:P27 family predicted phage terminase small subunit